MNIKEAVAAIPAVDLERAGAFYADTLGLTLEVLSDDLGMLWATAGTSRFLLYRRDEAPKAEHTALSFTTDDVDATVAALEAKGVVFYTDDTGTKVFELGTSRSAWFQDPDGNHLEISQRP